jgi:ribosomal protein S18 acetylase RimI-like enzyme
MDNLEVSLQSATWRDFRAIYRLEKTCFEEDAWPWIDVLAALTFPETIRIKAIMGDRIIGFVIGDRRRWQKMSWIASIGVHPDMRRRGVGLQLLDACEDALGTSRVRLALRPSNSIAKQLYLKAGYVEIDHWRRYYANGEDALIMEKSRGFEMG